MLSPDPNRSHQIGDKVWMQAASSAIRLGIVRALVPTHPRVLNDSPNGFYATSPWYEGNWYRVQVFNHRKGQWDRRILCRQRELIPYQEHLDGIDRLLNPEEG
jgi:hypothetical protein